MEKLWDHGPVFQRTQSFLFQVSESVFEKQRQSARPLECEFCYIPTLESENASELLSSDSGVFCQSESVTHSPYIEKSMINFDIKSVTLIKLK